MLGLTSALFLSIVLAASSPVPVVDDSGSQATEELPTARPDIDVSSDAGSGEIGAGVALPAGASTEQSGQPTRPPCSWTRAVNGDFRDTPGTATGEGARPSDPVVQRDASGAVTRTGWWKECPPQGAVFVWVEPSVDIESLIDGAAARIRRTTPVPVPDINPPPPAGSIVNLGMWLAVQDPGATVAQVGVAGEWARVEASHTGFTVDFGNGDEVTCDGVGTPIVDPEVVDEGPCGYTYRRSSPDDTPFQVTITSNYVVTYATSTGRSGTLAPISRSTTFAYDVDEIQTVGVSN